MRVGLVADGVAAGGFPGFAADSSVSIIAQNARGHALGVAGGRRAKAGKRTSGTTPCSQRGADGLKTIVMPPVGLEPTREV